MSSMHCLTQNPHAKKLVPHRRIRTNDFAHAWGRRSEEMGLTMAQRKAFTRELAQRYLRATPSR